MYRHRLVHVSGNAEKVLEMSAILKENGLDLATRKAVDGLDMEGPEETGTTARENASIKLEFYASLARTRGLAGSEVLILFADDTELAIKGLDDEPGIRIRRWKDGVTPMTDEEIIAYALERMRLKGLKGEGRSAIFRTTIAAKVIYPSGSVSDTTFETGMLRGRIATEMPTRRTEGKPFNWLFFVPPWNNMFLGELPNLPPDLRRARRTHRERATERLLPWIREQVQLQTA